MKLDLIRTEVHKLQRIQYHQKQANLWENIDPDILEQAYKVPLMFVKAILPHLPIELSENQKRILKEFYDPEQFYTELLLACGRKSGKTLLVAIIALYEVYKLLLTPDLHKKYGLIPNSRIYIMVVATSREQALGVTYNYIRALAEGSWYLSDYIVNLTSEEIEFAKNIVIRCQACSSRSGRGFATWMNIYDEIAHMQTSHSNMAGDQVYNALQPNLKVFRGDGKTICISSPAGMEGIFWELFKTGEAIDVLQPQPEHGKQKWRAVWQLPTWQMNPTLPRNHPELVKEFEADPDNFEMEYGAIFANVVNPALHIKQIMDCAIGQMIDPDVPERKIPRVVILDPATIGNSYGVVMGHLTSKDKVIVDLVRPFKGTKKRPVNINEVENFVRMLCRNFKIVHIGIDQHQSYSTVQKFQREGKPIRLVHITPKLNMDMYGELIRRINTERIEYPDLDVVTESFKFLQKKFTGWGWRVEAAHGHLDDVPDCIAHLCYVLTETQGQAASWGEM